MLNNVAATLILWLHVSFMKAHPFHSILAPPGYVPPPIRTLHSVAFPMVFVFCLCTTVYAKSIRGILAIFVLFFF